MMGLETNVGLSGYGVHGGGGGFGGGAGITPTIALQGAHSGGSACCVPYPVMMGNGGGFGGGFGGDNGIWAILLLSLLGRNGFGGGNNDCNGGFGGAAIPTIISDNINGRFSALSDQVTAGDNALSNQITSNGIIDAVRSVDANVCAGFLQTQKGFGDVALESCRQTGTVITALNAGVNSINSNVTQVGTQGLIAEMNTQRQLSDCCCNIEREIMQNRFLNAQQTCEINQNTNMGIQKILDKMCDNELKTAYAKIQELQLDRSQCAQNAYLASLINPPLTKSIPVSGSQPLFPTVISADAFCGFGDTSFRNRGNYGNNCGC